MRNPPHVCTSVRSLQPMYVHPSLQHICVHRFDSQIHLHNTGWLASNQCEHLSRHSTCIFSQHIACASICSLQPTLPVHRCSTSARPSLRCADALASTGLAFERACAETPDRACQNHRSNVHLLAAHCLRFNPFTATHAARPSLQYICASISSLRGCTRVDGFGSDTCAKPSLSKSPVKRTTCKKQSWYKMML